MTDHPNGKGATQGPLPLDELWALRTDYRDIPCPELGGTELRAYALTGTARARLVPEMAALVANNPDDASESDPAVTRQVMEFKSLVAAAGLGYPEDLWPKVGDALGAPVIERIFDVVMELSAIGPVPRKAARERLRPARSSASGTG